MVMKIVPEIVKVMTPFAEVISGTASLSQAQSKLEQHGRHYVAVVIAGAVKGVISSRDIALADKLACSCSSLSDLLVADFPMREPYLVQSNTRIGTVISHMLASRQDVAVVLKNDRVVGTFALYDALKYLMATIAGAGSQDTPPDLLA